jgi:mono/diheme cytochrome c family protein
MTPRRKYMSRLDGLSGRFLVAPTILFAIVLSSRVLKAQDTASLYKSKCVACHGADGKGESATGKAMKVKDFSSQEVQRMSDADLSTAISSGKAKMPPYKTLTADQVKDLVAYTRAFGKKK